MLIQKNFAVRNASGDILVHVDNVRECRCNAGCPDKNHLIIKLLSDADDAIEDIEKFLAGDLSTITVDYDLVYNESGEFYSHKVKKFTEYTLNPVVNRYYPSYESKNLTYDVVIFQQNDEYKLALQNNIDLLDMHEAIATVYETMETKED